MNIFRIKPEIIAVHVPKTAGSTFHAVLKNAYGWRLKHIHKFEDMHIWNNGLPYKSNKPFVQAVYGHIEAHPNWLRDYPESKLITWVRDPTERVISAYYHWMKDGDNQDERQRKFLREKPSLVEFVESGDYALTINAYSIFLGRLEPENYTFVGRTECFDKDLKRLESVIGRTLNYEGKQANVNTVKPMVNTKEKVHITNLLTQEYEIYRSLLSIN